MLEQIRVVCQYRCRVSVREIVHTPQPLCWFPKLERRILNVAGTGRIRSNKPFSLTHVLRAALLAVIQEQLGNNVRDKGTGMRGGRDKVGARIMMRGVRYKREGAAANPSLL